MDDQVPEDVKAERLQRLQDAIDRQQAAFNRGCVGRTFDVLFEKPGRHPGQIVGRSPYLQPVQVDGAGIADRRDRRRWPSPKSSSNSLFGVLVHNA